MNCESHPARGAWIETIQTNGNLPKTQSHPARGAWIETILDHFPVPDDLSHPARGAWIETIYLLTAPLTSVVAPRKGGVD